MKYKFNFTKTDFLRKELHSLNHIHAHYKSVLLVADAKIGFQIFDSKLLILTHDNKIDL